MYSLTSGRGHAPPYLGNRKPALSEGFSDWPTTSPMGLRGASRRYWRPLRTTALWQLRTTSQPTMWEAGLPPCRSAQSAGPANGGGDWRRWLLIEWRGSRARLYREGALRLEVGVAGCWRAIGDCSVTAGRTAAGSGAAFESSAPGRLCTLAPCPALGPSTAPADPCAPRVPGRQAQLFGKGAA